MTAVATTGTWDVSNEEYHADLTADSHSSLEIFRGSIEEYAAVRVHKTMTLPEPTAAMVLGSAFHLRLLEPDKFESKYVLSPKFDRRTKEGKAAAAAFEVESGGRIALSQDEWSLLHGMREGVMRNRKAAAALSDPGRCELAVRWECSRTGLPLKSRFDRILDNGLVVDIKTTDDPSPEAFAKTIANYGYARQAALYLEGAWAALQADGPFVFVAVGKHPPHETVCMSLDNQSLELGRNQNIRTINELFDRRQRQDWSGRWRDEIHEVTLPRWSFSEA